MGPTLYIYIYICTVTDIYIYIHIYIYRESVEEGLGGMGNWESGLAPGSFEVEVLVPAGITPFARPALHEPGLGQCDRVISGSHVLARNRRQGPSDAKTLNPVAPIPR